ncbi:cell division protein PerM [Rhodococcus sp. WMMA185]|uniref:cell division protein PerM n=1 Tax=Rhodococcus sp. WMMA185 TaxID=679318 RepID=UPI003FA7A772
MIDRAQGTARGTGGRKSADAERRVRRQRPVPDTEVDETRMLLTLAFRPAAVTVVLLSTLIVVTLVVASSDLTGTFGAIAAGWLAIHQVPLTIEGTTLGVLPLFPTLGLGWAVARGCAAAVTPESSPRQAFRVIGAAVAGPLVVTAIALAVIADASAVIPLSSPHALTAFAWVFFVHLLAAAIGVVAATWPTLGAHVPSWARDAVRPGLRAMMAILGAGAGAVTISLLMGWSTVGSLLERGDDTVGMLGLTILSVLYLPNVVVGAAAALTGATAQFGDVSVSVFGNVGGSLPPLPLLGAVPDGVAGGFWPALLVIPLLIGVVLGRDCGRRIDGQQALFAVLIAAAGVGIILSVLGLVSGGRLGAFGMVQFGWWVFGLLTFAWLAFAGAATAVIVVWHHGRGETGEAESGLDEKDEEPRLPGAQDVRAIAAPVGEESSILPGDPATGVIEAELVDDSGAPTTSEPPTVVAVGAGVVDAEIEVDEVANPEVDLPEESTPPSD